MMLAFISSLVPLVALAILLKVNSCCSALSLPLDVVSNLANTTFSSSSNSNSDRPEDFAIAEATGFKIRFNAYGDPLRPNDCADALIVAQYSLLREAQQNPGHTMILDDTRTFIIDSVSLTLRARKTLTYALVALFIVGMMECGTQYGFSEVAEIAFIDSSSSPLATAGLEALGNHITLPQSNQTANTTSSLRVMNATDPFNDPFLYPLPTVPGFYIRFMTHDSPLPRYDCLRALEAADATLLMAYQGKVRLFHQMRTWTFGKASFTITPTSELTAIDATLFVLGTMQLGSERGFVEAKGIFLRTEPDLRGELKFYGTGRLSRVGSAVS